MRDNTGRMILCYPWKPEQRTLQCRHESYRSIDQNQEHRVPSRQYLVVMNWCWIDGSEVYTTACACYTGRPSSNWNYAIKRHNGSTIMYQASDQLPRNECNGDNTRPRLFSCLAQRWYTLAIVGIAQFSRIMIVASKARAVTIKNHRHGDATGTIHAQLFTRVSTLLLKRRRKW